MSDGRADVVVVGGGPAGAVCAARLAQRGLAVVVLEKERFPRFRVGESLLPHSLPALEAIGVLPAIERRFLWKYGARFHDDTTGKKDRFAFAGAWRSELDHSFQVTRADFDAILLAHAASLGAEVREGWRASGVLRRADGRIVGVRAASPEGEAAVVEAGFVVDASGRDALLAREAGRAAPIAGLDQTAVFAHFDGVPRPSGERAGDVDVILVRDPTDGRPQWLWVIPFEGGRASVGAVVSRAWIRRGEARDPAALFARAVASSPTAAALLAPATMAWDAPRAAADFSYRVAELAGEGWLAVGDAGGFIDPLFSSGAHLAMAGAMTAADLVADAGGAPSRDALDAWSSRMRRASDTFLVAVEAFYDGALVEYLFADNKHTALRRSVTSLLAGDVFDDAVWLRDARRRLAAMRRTAAGV